MLLVKIFDFHKFQYKELGFVIAVCESVTFVMSIVHGVNTVVVKVKDATHRVCTFVCESVSRSVRQ